MDHLWKHSSASDFDFSSFQLTDSNVTKMDQLWRIALCAQNTDVSMKAIQILNTVYFSKGEEFLTTCMRSLEIAAQDLKSGKDEILLRIQRALLLLKTYLETFRKKYAYNFRRMSIDGHGVSTHAELLDLRSVGPIRVVVQAAGFQEKVTLEMQASDLIADLRAEISAWWEGRISAERNAMAAAAREGGGGSGGNLHHAQLLGTILGDGPLRLISQGQEISADFDEKNLMDYGFKDLQMVFVSQGASRQQQGVHGAKMASNNMDVPAFPGKDKMPMNILLKPEHFEQLFSLMLRLSELRSPPDKNGYSLPLQKAQIFSRRVWDILMLLPTNPQVKTVFENIGRGTTEEDLKKHMSPDSPQKLMYTFYIVDWLGRPSRVRRHSGAGGGGTAAPSSSSDPQEQDLPWIQKFIKVGGLKHLFDILISGRLQRREDSAVWCEWRQDCLGALLKLLVQFGVDTADYEALADQMLEASSTPRKRLKRYHANRNVSGGGMGSDASGENRMLVPRLSNHLLEMMNVDTVMPKITSVFIDASYTKDLAQYRTGVFGRAQVVHFAMNLLLAWLYSVNNIEDAFFTTNGLPAWLRSLLLEDPDPAVRREMCSALYKMCLGSTTDGRTGSSCTAPLLSILLEFLDDALAMTPARRESVHASIDDSKELYGPACRDYFWILSRLVDNLHTRPGCDPVDSGGLIDLDMLARQLACGLVARPLYEKRQANPISDDCLVGSLNLLSCVMKHEPAFKSSQEGMDFLLHLLECLFALPSPKEKDLPKCKSAHARSSCYDLLIEMCKGSSANYTLLHNKLLEQHKPESHKQYPWEYWPRDDGRSECGYVGLTNLGATCYLASCVQQLYMIPQARACILKSKVLKESKHTATLEELQRMFAYLRESERKAYNPLSFCKTYHMDHKPLNTGEQKDMAEFFIDLLSKMEDMSPDLKTNVKKLFGGTLTNNVVSLDCEHVSRTVEEFYTVRCTVQELRSLTQSLEEVTVKDTLEGDNMYTCSSCGKKVRAEKRACFKKLPKIIAFNTMRYTFNMVTMLKEKVNTHFSFPFKLDMSGYMEENLIPEGKKDVKKDVEEKKEAEDGKSPSASSKNEEEKKKKEEEEEESPEDKDPSYEYELIGVTVHTGTAEGGHYYAFIRDRTTLQRDKWYSFNDAEVKPFDPSQIASECFGGEVASKTYDQVHDKFMELSIEKTNSAYMLFYERVEKGNQGRNSLTAGPSCVVKAEEENNSGLSSSKEGATATSSCLTQELDEWIWKDNMTYIKDINVFDHTYFK